jgi:hypothetical protein
MGDRKGTYGGLVGIPERKNHLKKSRHRWEDNIKKGLKTVECGIVD